MTLIASRRTRDGPRIDRVQGGQIESEVAARGFTLLEVMVVVVILAFSRHCRAENHQPSGRSARDRRRQDIASVMQALKLYRLDNQRSDDRTVLQALWAPRAPRSRPTGRRRYLEACRRTRGQPLPIPESGAARRDHVFSFVPTVPRRRSNDADIGSWNI